MVSTTQYLDLERKAQAELDYDTDMRSMKVIEDTSSKTSRIARLAIGSSSGR